MTNSKPPANSVKIEYQERYDKVLKPIASALEEYVQDWFSDQPRIDRIIARAKTVDSFEKKAIKEIDGKPKYLEPLNQIQDQIGCRIITLYTSDVEQIDRKILSDFRAIEYEDRIPESDWTFGYSGRHYVLLLPADVIDPSIQRNWVPWCFELQVKTLFEHAWSEAGHDLGYKPAEDPLTSDQQRRLAFTAAQAWGADRIFDELFKERAEP